MEVVFRADASPTIGLGHISRCLALARALRSDGASCTFVCRPADGDLREQIAAAGMRLLGVNGLSADDTMQTLQAAGVKPAWLVVDHYQLDRDWESAMRRAAPRIMAIDDRPQRPHDCDVFLDQNLVANGDEALELAKGHRVALIGTDYALLQPAYRELRANARPRSGAVRRCLISFGGADRFGLTLGATRAVLAQTTDTAIDVVISSAIPDRAEIEQLAARTPRISIHVNASSLAPMMLAADLGIGAAGSTSWERLCMGLPSLVMTFADNQVPLAQALSDLGLAIWAGGREHDLHALETAIAGVIRSGIDESWSRRCFDYVDGKGAARVAAVLSAAPTQLRVRPAADGDERRVLRWANDPVTRNRSFSSRTITADEHHTWFQRAIANAGMRLFIVETATGVEIGQVRFQQHDDDWEVHYAVAPEFRGRGIGRHLLAAALDEFAGEYRGRIIGRVKNDNPASQRIFTALGFAADSTEDGTITYARTY